MESIEASYGKASRELGYDALQVSRMECERGRGVDLKIFLLHEPGERWTRGVVRMDSCLEWLPSRRAALAAVVTRGSRLFPDHTCMRNSPIANRVIHRSRANLRNPRLSTNRSG